MSDKLPQYKPSLDQKYSDGEELGVNEIAFVSDPAILIKGIAFSNQMPKYRIAAPALIPMNIYRVSQDMGEYEVCFTEQDIEAIVQDFMSKSKTAAFNLEHQSGKIAPAYILESWLVRNPETDQSKTVFGIDGIKEGSWFVVAQITDPVYYEQLVKNNQVGFSIEGFLGLEIKQNKMTKKFKLADVKTADGLPLFIDGAIEPGTAVFIIDTLGDKVVPEDGLIELEDGSTIEVMGGVISEVASTGEEASDSEGEGDSMDMAVTDTQAPVETQAPIETPIDAPVSEKTPSLTTDEVNSLIDAKVKDLVTMISDLQTQIETMGTKSQDIITAAPSKMSVTERIKVFYSRN